MQNQEDPGFAKLCKCCCSNSMDAYIRKKFLPTYLIVRYVQYRLVFSDSYENFRISYSAFVYAIVNKSVCVMCNNFFS
jgi:hypothetical protein